MSLDHPQYEIMRAQHSRAARWWRWGDSLYYVGLIGAIQCLPGAVLHCVHAGSWRPLLWWGIGFLASVGLFSIGVQCKMRSYRIAADEGLNLNPAEGKRDEPQGEHNERKGGGSSCQ